MRRSLRYSVIDFAPIGPDVRLPSHDHLRALAQRVEVDRGEVHIMGSKSNLLRVLATNGAATAAGGVPIVVPKWRTREQVQSDEWGWRPHLLFLGGDRAA